MDSKTLFAKLAGSSHLILILAVVITLLAFTKTVPGGCSDESRLATAESLAERGTFVIEESFFSDTCDKVIIDGHFYSDKAPLMGAYLAVIYSVLYYLFGISIASDPPTSYYLLSIFSTGVFVILLLHYMKLLLERSGASRNVTLFLTAAAYFSTILLPYSLTINNHIPAVALVVGAYYYFYGGRYFLAGFFGSLATVIDPTAFFFIFPLLFSRNFIKIAVAGAPVSLAFMLWNYWMSGSVLPFKMQPELFNFEGS